MISWVIKEEGVSFVVTSLDNHNTFYISVNIKDGNLLSPLPLLQHKAMQEFRLTQVRVMYPNSIRVSVLSDKYTREEFYLEIPLWDIGNVLRVAFIIKRIICK